MATCLGYELPLVMYVASCLGCSDTGSYLGHFHTVSCLGYEFPWDSHMVEALGAVTASCFGCFHIDSCYVCQLN